MKLRIEKEVYGGDGLTRGDDGQVLFVPYVLPGELVEIVPAEGRAGSANARAVRIEEAAAGRVVARCMHFGRCGGCQYQHASYELQMSIKQDILSETLERAGLRNRPKIDVHAGDPWAYRNRIRLRIERHEGAIRFGYNLRETNAFLPIKECPVAAPLLLKTAAAFLELSGSDRNCEEWIRRTAEIELFTPADEQMLQLTLLMRETRSSGFAELCERLREMVPALAGAGAVLE